MNALLGTSHYRKYQNQENRNGNEEHLLNPTLNYPQSRTFAQKDGHALNATIPIQWDSSRSSRVAIEIKISPYAATQEFLVVPPYRYE